MSGRADGSVRALGAGATPPDSPSSAVSRESTPRPQTDWSRESRLNHPQPAAQDRQDRPPPHAALRAPANSSTTTASAALRFIKPLALPTLAARRLDQGGALPPTPDDEVELLPQRPHLPYSVSTQAERPRR